MDPFKNMQEWKKNMDRFFGEEFWNEFEGILKPPIPQVNMYQSDNEIICICNIPGIDDGKKIDVLIDYASIQIRGEMNVHPDYGGHLIQEEILQGAFDRTLELPFPVRSDKYHADYQNGLLIIHLYRLITKESNKRKVPIKIK
ncbi:HSP20 family protein [Melghiribacillus thermohalophilus]|uniref:HSP20 family protein n=2 Tax=Melghiribacillus thermohalophilus TaxID=1324956 RepID=A0A4R3MRF7_9BACI|nr:HSP20 family protein [Melghiribacillus thermohalophilus]